MPEENLEKIIPQHKDKQEHFLKKLIKIIDDDSFFWDKPAKVADFFDKEVRERNEIQEKVLFPYLKKVLPACDAKAVLEFEKDHQDIEKYLLELGKTVKAQSEYPSKESKKRLINVSRIIIELIFPHTKNEDEKLSLLIKKYFKQKDLKELEKLFLKHSQKTSGDAGAKHK
jgi:hypothetical protein